MNRETAAPFRRFLDAKPRLADGAALAVVALVARLGVALWAGDRFPPAEDGRFYHVVATRIAQGLGYTWLWPDGAVTYAAHYPVGYPALIGAAYAAFSALPVVAMVVNAMFGALLVFAVHRVASTEANRGGAMLAGMFVALHPGLLFYTPALMTEGVAASLLAVAAWLSVRAMRRPELRSFGVLAVALGVATLVRPQSLLLAPLYAVVAALRLGPRLRFGAAVAVTLGAVAVCLPWTLRNCHRMNTCVLVSANAGWNLLIGAAPGATGSWVPLEQLGVPKECATIWGEAEKDACFGRAGLAEIRKDLPRFVSLIPKKIAVTFDYAGAAGWYLHSSNAEAFGDQAKLALGAAETIWQRVIVLLGLLALGRVEGPRRGVRRAGVILSAAWLFTRWASVAHAGLIAVALLLGRRLANRPAVALGAATVFATMATHAAFFGAGRYSLVCFPALAALSGTVLTAANEGVDNGGSKES